MRKRVEKFFALLHGFVTKKLSRHLTVVVACFALLPFGVTVGVGLVGALKGFEFARDFLLSDKIEAERRSLGNHLALQSSMIEERIGDISFEAKLLALEASGMLGRPEGYPLPEDTLLPRIDTETRMALTPKESGISIRLPAGTPLTEQLQRKILALDYIAPQLRLVHERFKDISVGVNIFSREGIEVVYPWHDFKASVSKGVLTPVFFKFRDWEYAAAIRRLPAGGVFVTPRYKGLYGKSAILSVCSPVVSKGQRLGIACIDIDESSLFSLVRPYPGYEIKIILLDAQKNLVGITNPLRDKEKPFIRKIIGEVDFANVTSGSRESVSSIIMWEHARDSGFTLIGVVDKGVLAAAVSPVHNKFSILMRLSKGSGLALTLILVAAIAYGSIGVRKRIRKTLDAFIGPLGRIAAGDQKARITYKGYEELEFISGTINQTLDALQSGRAELERSEKDLEEQNVKLKEYIETIEAQRSTIEQLSTPVIPIIKQTVLVPVIGVFDSMRAFQLGEKLLETIKKERVKHVVFDMTGCGLIDTHTLKAMTNTMRAVRVLGGRVHVVGFQPQIVRSLIGLGIELEDISIDVTLDRAILKIQHLLGSF